MTGRPLLRDPEFLKLWAGQTISSFGSGITANALPLTAVLVLGASASSMGWLLALESAPVLLVGMVAGVWVDRSPRRALLIGADLGRAGLLACIPALAVLGALRIEHLLAVAAATGVLTVLFDVAYRAYIPGLVGRARVLEANSRLASMGAIAEITTPGLTGALVQAIAPPLTILLDATSFVGSALLLVAIQRPEPNRSPPAESGHVWREVGEGLRSVVHSPLLRALASWDALRNFFGMFIGALYVLFGLRELGLSPLLIGISIGVGGASNLLGTLLVPRVTHRFGAGRTIMGATLIGCIGPLLVATAPGRPVEGFAFLVAGQALDFIQPLYQINALTLRQVTTAEDLLGRVNACMHVIGRGTIPLGALAGGILGEAIGLRPTLLLAAFGIIISAAWLARSPALRQAR